MSRVLEILGAAIAIDTADLIWHWLDTVRLSPDHCQSERYQQLNRAIELTAEGKLDSAEEQLNVYLFESPSCALGRLAVAAIHIRNSRLQKAVEELETVYDREPSNTMALYALGHCYERLGKEAQAIAFYQDCLKFKNYLQLPAQRLGAIYFKNGQLEKAIEEYEVLKNEYPGDTSTLVTLGHLYIVTGRYSSAIETFNKAILMQPDNFGADDEYLVELIGAGRLQEALEYVDNVLQQQGERADMLVKRGDVLNLLGEHEDAVEQYQGAIGIYPDFLEAIIKLGAEYMQLQQDQLAAKQFNKALEANDKIVDAYIGLAISQQLAGEARDALATLSLAAAIQPNSSLLFAETANLQFQARLGVGSVLWNENSSTTLMDAVIRAHHEEVTRRPTNPDLHYRLGLLMLSIGRTSDALESFQNALKLNPTYHRARTKLAICLFETDQPQEALERLTAREAITVDAASVQLHYKVALLYCDRPKFASSLINLQQLLQSNHTGADPGPNISIVLQNLGLLERETATWDNLCDTAEQATNPQLPF